jgi:hypothetical protein
LGALSRGITRFPLDPPAVNPGEWTLPAMFAVRRGFGTANTWCSMTFHVVSRRIPCNPGLHGIHRDTCEMVSRRDRDYDSSFFRTKNRNLDLATELKAFFKLIMFRILQEFGGSTFSIFRFF